MGTYVITTTDEQDKCLKYMIPDVQEWLQGSMDGRINHCTKTFVRDWVDKLEEDDSVSSIPSKQSEFITTVMARSDYKDRAARDAEEQAKAKARREKIKLEEEAKAKAQAEADAKEAAEAEAKALADAEALQATIEAGVVKALAAQ